jgi:hypothetical protein
MIASEKLLLFALETARPNQMYKLIAIADHKCLALADLVARMKRRAKRAEAKAK